MTDFSPMSKAPAFKDAFYAMAKTQLPKSTQVSFGHPGISNQPDIVACLDLTSEQAEATLSAARRTREETLTLEVMVSCFRNGYGDSDKVVSDAAYALLGTLEEYVRTTDTTLGGVVRECFLTSHTSTGYTDPQSLAQGRTIDIRAIFTAHARISS